MSSFQFPGLNLAIATPFDANGQIDYVQLERNIEKFLAVGIKGFVLSSGTGMHVYLSQAESLELIERGAKLINGRAKIIAQTSALLAADVIERTRRSKDAGADGVMILPPFFEGPTDDQGVINFYTEAATGGLPIIGYNVPQAVGVAVTPSLLAALCKIPNFVAVKDSSGDFGSQIALVQTGLPVMNGSDNFMPYSLYVGTSGLIWGGANVAPKTCQAVVSAAQAGNWDDARRLWKDVEPFMTLLSQGDYVQSVYAAAELTGYGAGNPRKPLHPLSKDRVATVKAALDRVIEIEGSSL